MIWPGSPSPEPILAAEWVPRWDVPVNEPRRFTVNYKLTHATQYMKEALFGFAFGVLFMLLFLAVAQVFGLPLAICALAALVIWAA